MSMSLNGLRKSYYFLVVIEYNKYGIASVQIKAQREKGSTTTEVLCCYYQI